MTLLDIKNLDITYKVNDKRIYAVKNFSLSVEQNDSIGIVGESGSGKSTLAMGILRLLSEQNSEIKGEICYKGKDLLSLTEDELKKIRWKDISMVFQKSMNSLSPVHKIGKQMEDVYKAHNANCKKSDMDKKIGSLFSIVNLPQKTINTYPHELSGGMMQRVSIALSLINNPKLLIMDEATTALDVVTQGQMLDEIIKLEHSLNLTRIMITHDLSVVSSTCKKVAVMYAGYLVEYGSVEDVLINPLHPYTVELLKSHPTLIGDEEPLSGIPGSLPDLSVKLEGCAFANRCKLAADLCFKEIPKVYLAGNNRKIACHLQKGEQNE